MARKEWFERRGLVPKNLILPTDKGEKIDKFATEHRLTKSELVAKALEKYYEDK